jgi:hypothetical protein
MGEAGSQTIMLNREMFAAAVNKNETPTSTRKNCQESSIMSEIDPSRGKGLRGTSNQKLQAHAYAKEKTIARAGFGRHA